MAITKVIKVTADTKQAETSVKKLTKETDNLNDSTQDLTNSVDSLTGGALSRFSGLRKSIGNVTKGFKSLKVAIAATGLGLLLLAITGIIQAFRRSEEGQNKFAKGLAVIGAVTDQLLDLLADFGEAIISVFENPQQALKDFGNLIKDNLQTRFEGLINLIPSLGSAINLLFKGEFSEAGKVAADAVGKVVLGVDSVTESLEAATKATSDFIAETEREARIAGQIADQRAAANIKERELIVARAKADRDLADLREKAEQRDRFNLEERIGFLEQAGKIQEDITNQEIEVAKIRRDAIEAENALGKSTDEQKKAAAEATANVIRLETQRLNIQKALTARIQSLTKEQEALNKAQAETPEVKLDPEEEKRIQKEKDRLSKIEDIRKSFRERNQDAEAQNEFERIELQKQRDLAELDKLNATEQQKQDVILFYANQVAKEEERITKLTNAAKLQVTAQTLNALQSLATEGSDFAKGVAIAQTTIDTYQSATASYNSLASIKYVGPILGGIAAAAAVASGFANVRRIKQTDSTTGTPSGFGSSGTPQQAPSFDLVQGTQGNQIAETIQAQNQQPVKSYVVSKDVTTNQELDRNIVENSVL